MKQMKCFIFQADVVPLTSDTLLPPPPPGPQVFVELETTSAQPEEDVEEETEVYFPDRPFFVTGHQIPADFIARAHANLYVDSSDFRKHIAAEAEEEREKEEVKIHQGFFYSLQIKI